MANLYPSDVRSLSDEELEVLSAELEEAYRCSGYEDDYWLDDAAEARYWEMHAEQHRRYCVAHPEWKPPEPSEVTRIILRSVAAMMETAREFHRTFEEEFTGQVGNTVTIQKPYRYQP